MGAAGGTSADGTSGPAGRRAAASADAAGSDSVRWRRGAVTARVRATVDRGVRGRPPAVAVAGGTAGFDGSAVAGGTAGFGGAAVAGGTAGFGGAEVAAGTLATEARVLATGATVLGSLGANSFDAAGPSGVDAAGAWGSGAAGGVTGLATGTLGPGTAVAPACVPAWAAPAGLRRRRGASEAAGTAGVVSGRGFDVADALGGATSAGGGVGFLRRAIVGSASSFTDVGSVAAGRDNPGNSGENRPASLFVRSTVPVMPMPSPVRTLAAILLALCWARSVGADATGGVLTGRVLTPDAAAPRQARLIAIDEAGVVTDATVGPDGSFRADLPAGTYAVEVVANGWRSARLRALVLLPGEMVRLDVRLDDGDAQTGPPIGVTRTSAGVTFSLGPAVLSDLPLDRADAGAAILELTPGVARGTAFGAAADIGTPRRLDGLDLSDPLDGRAWTSVILPAATAAGVRAAVGADERDGSGAVLDVITRAGGATLRGAIDVIGGGQAWTRDTLPDDILAANPRLADRDRVGRSVRAAGIVSGQLRPHLGFGLAVEHADDVRADRIGATTRAPRVHGRLAWTSGERSANIVGFVDRRATTRDVPFAIRDIAAPGVENERTRRTIASRAGWQSPLRGLIRLSASIEVLHGARALRPTTDVPAREDVVTGVISGSLGLVEQGERTRTIASGAIDWRTAQAGGHDVRVGGDVERTQVTESASFAGGEFFHDVAGRADTVDVWSGLRRETPLRRAALFVTDTWTPGRRLAVKAGVRAGRVSGGAYSATLVQPRVGATLAVDQAARLVVRATAGVIADPLYASHVDRTVGGETPVVTYQILSGGRRVELDRTVPTVAGAASGIRHPQVREISAGADLRLARLVQVGGTIVGRRFLDAIDTTYAGARWLALARPGLDGRPVSIYRWLNRRADDAPTIVNVDGTSYAGADGQSLGVAAAGRDYVGVIGHVELTLPRDRGSIVVAIASARNRGTVDDTHDAGIGRSDRFASPTAVLANADGPSALTPELEMTVFGTSRLPLVPVRVSGIYQRLSGVRYAALRTFGAGTLNVPFDVGGRTLQLEPRGTRQLEPLDELTLRIASTLPFGKRRPLEIYADVVNVLRRSTVTAVETGSPIGVSSGAPVVFETPIDVQRPFRVLAGARFSF
jgi:hypothetical protein